MEGEKKISESLDENYFKMHLLIHNNAPSLLRKIFVKLWKDYDHSEWENKPAFGSKFISRPGFSLYKSCQRIQKEFLESGNVEAWDLSLLIESIKSLNTCMKLAHPQEDFAKLKEIRNKLAHGGGTALNDSDFKKYWKIATQILLKLGLSSVEIDQIKKMKVGGTTTTIVVLETEETQKVKDKVAELKEKGNKLFMQQEYSPAIKMYSEAIKMENVPSTELGILYSNRSASLAGAERFQEAKDDAKISINLRPNWGKGYYRLGYAYEKMEKFENALINYKLSLKFDPDNKNCLEARNACVHILAKRQREEHLDPLTMPMSEHDVRERIKEIGIETLPMPFVNRAQRQLFLQGNPTIICSEAHKYLHGLSGYQQSYEKAAGLFAKAASKGNAEGMYNLALLTSEGKGVKRDMGLAYQLRLQAANMTPVDKEILPGSGKSVLRVGVMEAQHSLGLLYENGGVVERDYREAYKWYTKALRNGAGYSANNLGIIFSEGKGGFPVDMNKAIGYWKVGALMGIVRATDSLAIHYFYNGPSSSALQFYTLALSQNTMNQTMKQLFQNEVPIQGFSVEAFEHALDQELLQNEQMKEFVSIKDYNYHPDGVERRRERRRKMLEISNGNNEDGTTSHRKQQIVDHRKWIKETRKLIMPRECKTTVPGKLVPTQSPDLIGLKPIAFNEMDKSIKDKIYEGYAIKVRVVEDALLGHTAINVLAEDKNADLEVIYVYNYPQVKATHDEIGFGCYFTIINPYLRLMFDGKWGIRIDDPNLLIKHPQMRMVDQCRFCGKNGGTVTCRHCKRVFYCSKECRHKDASELEHKLVCFKKI